MSVSYLKQIKSQKAYSDVEEVEDSVISHCTSGRLKSLASNQAPDPPPRAIIQCFSYIATYVMLIVLLCACLFVP